MLVSLVVVILWSVVTTTIATPPPGYIKPTSENDKNPAVYTYTYSIDNNNGIGQGKVESRSGELASGQYYINDEGSSTDVKYFADEWGYHPLVKYSATSSHSVANAQLAFGADSVGALVNDNDLHFHQQRTEKLLPSTPFKKQLETTVLPSTPSSVTKQANNLSATRIEDELIIENAGSFGQRLPDNTGSTTPKANDTYHTTPGLSAYSSTSSPIIHDISTSPSHIEAKNISTKTEVPIYNYKAALESIRQYFGSTSKDQEVENRVPLSGQVFHQEFSGLTNQDKTKSSQDSGDNSKLELLGRPESQVSPRLSKPIVVAEVPNSSTERYEYSTTFPCNPADDETIGSVTPSTIDKPTATPLNTLSSDTAVLVSSKLISQSAGIPTSSVILNPIQAGVALVNAGEAHLLSSDVEHSLHTASVKAEAATVNSEKTIETQDELYGAIKSKFNGYPAEASLTSNVDQTIEIQKSHEIYAHSLPVQEIHYPGEFVSQVVAINQLSPEYHLNVPATTDNVSGNSEIVKEKSQGYIKANSNLQYQSIAERPELSLQELETSPEGSTLLYQANSQVENNVNNLWNSENAFENYAIVKNTAQRDENTDENITGETNFSADTRIKPDSVYSAVGLGKLLQNVLVNVQQTGVNSDIVKRKQENTSDDNTKSSPKRFLASERQQNGYGLDTRITSSSVSPTETEMKEISTEIQEPTLQYSLSKDLGKNTIYIHGPTEQGLLFNIGNYASQPTRVYDKTLETEIFNAEKVQEVNSVNVQQDIPSPPIYSLYTNRIFEGPLIKNYPAERIQDNKAHYPVHKLVIPQQYYPVHIIQSYPVDKIAEKNIHIQQAHSVKLPTKVQYAPLELTNYVENSINLPYGVQYGVSYQQIMNPPSTNVYENNPIDQQTQTNASKQEFQGYNYDKPLIPFATKPGRLALTKRYGSLNQLTNNQLQQQQLFLHHQHQQQQQQQQQINHSIYPKKIHYANQVPLPLPPRSIDHQISGHRHLVYRTHDKGTNKNQEYMGPVPLPQPALNLHQQNQVVHPLHQETLRYLANAARSNGGGTGNFWRSRLPEGHYHARTSNFRQSKMEYGFKPPMVPSVQYDEQTATRVES